MIELLQQEIERLKEENLKLKEEIRDLKILLKHSQFVRGARIYFKPQKEKG